MVDGPAAWATLGPFEITYVRSIFARVDFGYNLFSEIAIIYQLVLHLIPEDQDDALGRERLRTSF